MNFSASLLSARHLVSAKEHPHAKPPANADQYYGLYQNPSKAIVPSRANGGDVDSRSSALFRRPATP